MSAAGRGRKKGKGASSSVFTMLLIMLPVGLIFLPSTILLTAGMIPTAVAYVVDRDPDKTAPMTVGGLNLAGVVTFLISLWQAGHTMAALTKVLTDPFAWLVMYGAAALGDLLRDSARGSRLGHTARRSAHRPEDQRTAGPDRPLGHGGQRPRRRGQGRVAS